MTSFNSSDLTATIFSVITSTSIPASIGSCSCEILVFCKIMLLASFGAVRVYSSFFTCCSDIPSMTLVSSSLIPFVSSNLTKSIFSVASAVLVMSPKSLQNGLLVLFELGAVPIFTDFLLDDGIDRAPLLPRSIAV